MSLSTNSTTQVLLQQPDHTPDNGITHLDEPLMCLTQHPVLQITLSGPGILLTILAIVVSIQILHPSLTCTLIGLSPLPWIVYNDYENFISLGPGGTPSTFLGYLKITYLRLFALSDRYTPAIFTETVYPTIGYYSYSQALIPKREGPRPTIAGIAPQRQLNQTGSKAMYLALRQTLQLVSLKTPTLNTNTSCFEKKGLALFAQHPINATCRGEICHVHHSDRSLHLNLHPDDAAKVLAAGWGERHPLAKGGWWKRFVPREFVMVYAPRDEAELRVVGGIVEAAGWWVAGERFGVPGIVETVLNGEVEVAK